MRFDWLESFVAFAETRNFTRAAERLHLSQPALHVQVKRLGEDLGVQLYRREGRSLLLTDEGREVEAFARETLARARTFTAELRSDVDNTPPVLVAGRGTHTDMLAHPLRRWVAGGRPLSLRSGDRERILDDVLTGRAHLGIAPLDEDVSGLTAYRFRRVGHVAVVPRDHPLAERSRVGLAVLGRHRLILPPADRPHRIEVSRALRRALGHEPEISVETGGWDLMMMYASLGLGAAVVNDSCTPPAGTTAIPITGLPTIAYDLVEREGGRLPPHAEALRDHLLAASA